MKRALILRQNQSHLPAVVKIINNLFKVEKQKVIIVFGYFNSTHKGHLEIKFNQGVGYLTNYK
jgi:hypothetical protein